MPAALRALFQSCSHALNRIDVSTTRHLLVLKVLVGLTCFLWFGNQWQFYLFMFCACILPQLSAYILTLMLRRVIRTFSLEIGAVDFLAIFRLRLHFLLPIRKGISKSIGYND